jgi:hypothetical protein
MTKINKLILKQDLLMLFIRYQDDHRKFMADEIQLEEMVNIGKELNKILKIK